MNLHVCVPYEECPFKCPMCIARSRKIFTNFYGIDPEKYLAILRGIRFSNKYDYYVLTGNTDPTLNKEWLENVVNFLAGKHVELQTRNYNLQGYNLNGIETVAYSISTLKDYFKSWKFRKIEGNNRLVILLTKEFEILTSENFNPMGYNQVTFKKLQLSADEDTNRWIEKNQMDDFSNIYGIINTFNGGDISVRFDTNCQDSHGRYEIFREDGCIYKKWESE